MGIGTILCVALCLPPPATDRTPPVIRMVTPARIGAARFVALRVTDGNSGVAGGTLVVNGTRMDVGDLVRNGRVRFRARLGWEPGRRYRVRMTASDGAGNVRELRRAIRPRNFGIVTLAIRDLTRARRAGASHAAGGCGYVHLRPRHIRLGSAPLALGDSVMLGAAWRLTRAGFESDTLCGRSPRAGLDVLRRRRAKGTLPEVVVSPSGRTLP